MESYEVNPIGWVDSELTHLSISPKQGNEGAPSAWLVVLPEFAAAVEDVTVTDRLLVITWLHLACRDTVQVHPRGDPRNRYQGFSPPDLPTGQTPSGSIR